MNCLPPPHEPLFQDNFERNLADLAEQIRDALPDIDAISVVDLATDHVFEPEPEEVVLPLRQQWMLRK